MNLEELHNTWARACNDQTRADYEGKLDNLIERFKSILDHYPESDTTDAVVAMATAFAKSDFDTNTLSSLLTIAILRLTKPETQITITNY